MNFGLIFRRSLKLLSSTGFGQLRERLARRRRNQSYQRWIKKYDVLTKSDREAIRAHLQTFTRQPLISILMPVYNVEERWLRLAVESVLRQLYPHWELCIADDCSPSPHIRRVLNEYAALDNRIKVVFREDNGHISAASNSALELASGEFCALLDHDDELSEHALYFVAEKINAAPQAEMIYSDEDMIDTSGKRYDAKFKPDWSPDFFYSLNFTTHLAVYRTATLRKIGGFRLGVEGSQDYDLALRVTEHVAVANIYHIEQILYHWRAIPGSVALDGKEKSYAHERARQAIGAHLERAGIAAKIVRGFADYHRVVYNLPELLPFASLILLIADDEKSCRETIENILAQTSYKNFELIVVSTKNFDLSDKITQSKHSLSFVTGNSDNIAQNLNLAVDKAHGEILVFLQNGLRIQTKDWLREIISQAHRPEIGAVGAKLVFANQTISNFGIVLGIKNLVGFSHYRTRRSSADNLARAQVVHNVSAVTSGCFAVRRALFQSVGGFDAGNFPDGLFEIDFCLRLLDKNYRHLVTPYAELISTKNSLMENFVFDLRRGKSSASAPVFKQKWSKLFERDPLYNQNLTLKREDFSLSFPPRMRKPWKNLA